MEHNQALEKGTKKVSGFLQEFKAFAMRGNVIDLAVGVVIGGAFGSITNSLVNDILMPALSMLTGGLDFSAWQWVLKEAVMENGEVITPAVAIHYGAFLSTILNFILLAFAVFCMIKAINRLHRKKEEPAPAPETPPAPSTQELLTEIRDLLKRPS